MADPQFTIQQLENEEWRPVVGYESLYSISNIGRIRRDAPRVRGSGGMCVVGRILKVQIDKGGYFYGTLYRDGKPKKLKVHVLVAAAFIGPRPIGKTVNHKDASNPRTMKLNNQPDNLEYLTAKEQMEHAKSNGLTASGQRSSLKKHPDSYPRVNGRFVTPVKA